MSGDFDWNGTGELLGTDAAPIVVARYDDQAGEIEPLPNVVCHGIEIRVGSDPPVARFSYLLDVLAEAAGFPTDVEDLWPLDATGPHVVKTDDRIVVITYTPDGDPRYLFDGHAQVPQADLTPGSVHVGFNAVGVAARCFDYPIGGRTQRDATDLEDGDDVATDLPTRFNPTDRDGRSLRNCSPDGHDADQDDDSIRHPVFVDENLKRDPEFDARRLWDLSGVCRYLMATMNADGAFVENPDFRPLDELLKVRWPKDESGDYDPDDPDSYNEAEIPVREFDATNRCWPEAVEALLGYAGFGFCWTLEADEAGRPRNGIDVYRLDQASARAPKVVWLDEARATIDPTRNNVEQFHLARDVNQVVNAWTVETRPRRVELAVVLAPGYTPSAADKAAGSRIMYSKSYGGDLVKYRRYVADEAGDGHYDHVAAAWTTAAPCDLSPVFPPLDAGTDPDGSPSESKPSHVVRLRPGSNRLISWDSQTYAPLKAALHFSQDYTGPVASIWDGTGTWYEITDGWRLLDDRLGIEVTVEDPEQWRVGPSKGELRGITWQADPPEGARFFLRLTTVIDDDRTLDSKNDKRIASPTRFERRRRIDGSDVYRMERIHKSSPYWSYSEVYEGTLHVERDDTADATDHANLLRAAHEAPPLAGSITLPFLTDAYRVGDRVRAIKGREIDLAANIGADQGEAPLYPVVVAVSYSFDGDRQATTLQLSDRRSETA